MWGNAIPVLVNLDFLSLGESVVMLAGVEHFSDMGLVVNFGLGGKVSLTISTTLSAASPAPVLGAASATPAITPTTSVGGRGTTMPDRGDLTALGKSRWFCGLLVARVKGHNRVKSLELVRGNHDLRLAHVQGFIRYPILEVKDLGRFG